MPDVFTKKKRSWVMSRIHGKDTKIEINLQQALKKRKLPYKLDYSIKGRPDFVFLKNKVAIFVDGCFWHRCSKHYNKPVNKRAFWEEKIAKNVIRDKSINRKLRREGWSVLRFWEHDIETNIDKIMNRIERRLNKN